MENASEMLKMARNRTNFYVFDVTSRYASIHTGGLAVKPQPLSNVWPIVSVAEANGPMQLLPTYSSMFIGILSGMLCDHNVAKESTALLCAGPSCGGADGPAFKKNLCALRSRSLVASFGARVGTRLLLLLMPPPSLGWTQRGGPGDLTTSWWLEQVVGVELLEWEG